MRNWVHNHRQKNPSAMTNVFFVHVCLCELSEAHSTHNEQQLDGTLWGIHQRDAHDTACALLLNYSATPQRATTVEATA